jgi:oligopeptide transport system substrate-binding protein
MSSGPSQHAAGGRHTDFVLLLPVLACLWLAGCEFAPAFEESNLLRVGQTGEPDSLDPHMAVSGPAVVIVNDLFEGLLTLDAEGQVQPGAAAAYTVSEDGLVYTFALRQGLRWSDGSPLTAEDFVYSLRRMARPETAGTALAVNIDLIGNGAAVLGGEQPAEALGVHAPDADTVVIELANPAPYFASIIATGSFGPVPRGIIEQHGRFWTRPDIMVSNGAFRLVEWLPNNYLRVERNPWFHAAESVALDGVMYFPVIDLNTGYRQFRAGELDTLTNFPPEKLALLRRDLPASVRISASLGLTAYLFNHRLPKFQDRRVREALALALDLERIVERILGTGDQPAYGLVPDDMPGYFPALAAPWADQPLQARQARARGLLAQAGYHADAPLEFELLFPNSAEHRKVAIAAAAMWREVGVEVRLRSGERQLIDAAARRGEFEVGRLALFAGFVDPLGFFSAVRSDSPVNGTGYANARLDALLAEAAGMSDPAPRAALLREAEQIAMQEHALLPLYFNTSRRLVSARVQGWPEANMTALRPARYLALADPTD